MQISHQLSLFSPTPNEIIGITLVGVQDEFQNTSELDLPGLQAKIGSWLDWLDLPLCTVVNLWLDLYDQYIYQHDIGIEKARIKISRESCQHLRSTYLKQLKGLQAIRQQDYSHLYNLYSENMICIANYGTELAGECELDRDELEDFAEVISEVFSRPTEQELSLTIRTIVNLISAST